MGFDSLLLTQAAQLLQSKFGIKVTFRQLMEDLGNIGSHRCISGQSASCRSLPACDYAVGATFRSRRDCSYSFPSAFTSGGLPITAIEEILRQQLRTTTQLLELLATKAPTSASPREEAGAVQVLGPTHAAGHASAVKIESQAHGPFRPVDRGTGVA